MAGRLLLDEHDVVAGARGSPGQRGAQDAAADDHDPHGATVPVGYRRTARYPESATRYGARPRYFTFTR